METILEPYLLVRIKEAQERLQNLIYVGELLLSHGLDKESKDTDEAVAFFNNFISELSTECAEQKAEIEKFKQEKAVEDAKY